MKQGATSTVLSNAIASASRAAFSALFAQHPGRYYYCALVTTGEAHAPILSAWSEEALRAAIAGAEDEDEMRRELRWSYADSPYCGYGSDHFSGVNTLFSQRQRLTPALSDEQWTAEFDTRLGAMEAAMAQLDSEGLFGKGEDRLRTVVLVEVAPPDHSNVERALRLNPPAALADWMREAAERD